MDRRVRSVGSELYRRINGSRTNGAPRDSTVFSCGTAKGLSGICDERRLCLRDAGDAGLGGIASYDGSLVLLATGAGGEVEAVGQIADFLSRVGGRRVSLSSRHNCLT